MLYVCHGVLHSSEMGYCCSQQPECIFANYNVEQKKPDTKVHLWFHSCIVLKQAKQIHGVRSQNSAFLCQNVVVTSKRRMRGLEMLYFLTWSMGAWECSFEDSSIVLEVASWWEPLTFSVTFSVSDSTGW